MNARDPFLDTCYGIASSVVDDDYHEHVYTSRGQTAISQVREKYNLKDGDCLAVKDNDEKVALEVAERYPILGLRGAFKGKGTLTQALLEERKAQRKMENGHRE